MDLQIWISATTDPSKWYVALPETSVLYYCNPNALTPGTPGQKQLQFLRLFANALVAPFGSALITAMPAPGKENMQNLVNLPPENPAAEIEALGDVERIWVVNPAFEPANNNFMMWEGAGGQTVAQAATDEFDTIIADFEAAIADLALLLGG